MNRFIRNSALAASAALAVSYDALSQHAGDIGLSVTDGRIVTTEIDSQGIGSPRRVFAGTLGDTGSPHFTSNPGFDALPSTFAVGTRVGFRFVAPLLQWNGQSFVPTDASGPLLGERMRASFLTLQATTADGPVAGFDLAVQANGGWHRHLSWTLLAAPGQPSPDAGAYVVQIQMYSTDPSVADSQPLAIMFNNGASSEEALAAFKAASSLLDPSPCPGDLNGSGAVDGADLGQLLSSWGMSGSGDLTGDGVVNG
ncbi:MAG: hypothetical protein JNK53_02785, partial [Phycisphaerae bacterium]|nr:hypothetical protein [Phycisphaerae bacterium]